MAEGALFSLASKLLSTIASPAFELAYERAQLIWGAKEELDKLKRTIQTIKAVLLDAEKKQEGSAAVKDWVERVRDVLYNADELFDGIATDDLFRRQMEGNKLLKKVHVFFSKQNPVVSRYTIAKKVKDIRKSLIQITEDMGPFEFVRLQEEPLVFGTGRRLETGSFVDPNEVIGRDDDKKTILEFLLDESYVEEDVSVIAIVGIGGMGKTTLAQLVYNDEEVQKKFEKKWWACISDVLDDKEVIGRMFQSITRNSYHHLQMSHLETDIRQSVSESGKFLLVLDDVWDDNHGRWVSRMSLLSSGAKGSKIIVTTRSTSVARAIGAAKTHQLHGLSKDQSWKLFKRLAFTREQENDPIWTSLGEEIVKKCANVPLAIKSIASLLYTKTTVEAWESFKDNELSKIVSDNPTMSALKLSYHHLPSNLKRCFAYCSLFPKDYVIRKEKLIYLWIAQGFVMPDNGEVGHSYFMELLGRSFFQEADEDEYGEIKSCKMHDLVHDLAQLVAGDECTMVSIQCTEFNNSIRHMSIGDRVDVSWKISEPLLNASRLRSCQFMHEGSLSPVVLDLQLTKFKFLRTVALQRLGIEKVPNSIGELRTLRYLDLSKNSFIELPESLTKLLNLMSLRIKMCGNLQALPNGFRKLINLRYLDTRRCDRLRYMPHGFGELSSLKRLPCFKVGKAAGGSKSSMVDSLAGLDLRGDLEISYDVDTVDWDEDEVMFGISRLPERVKVLSIVGYPGKRMPSLKTNFTVLDLFECRRVKHLPPLRCLPYIKVLKLEEMGELEYVEEENETVSSSTALFFPRLETLELVLLPKLKGWSRKVEAVADQVKEEGHPSPHDQMHSFPLLSSLRIDGCQDLKSMPLCPHIRRLILERLGREMVQVLLSGCSTTPSSPSSLQDVAIRYSNGLMSFPGEALTSLQSLEFWVCEELKKVCLPPTHLNVLEELNISFCKDLELWEEEKRGVDWDSLPKLRTLLLNRMPRPERLPDCLQDIQALGKLQIYRND